ncbi:MAG: hypothetical protein CMO98_05695 [Woeseia sp.]|nr:hypothetical protein [Woeseia sp.]
MMKAVYVILVLILFPTIPFADDNFVDEEKGYSNAMRVGKTINGYRLNTFNLDTVKSINCIIDETYEAIDDSKEKNYECDLDSSKISVVFTDNLKGCGHPLCARKIISRSIVSQKQLNDLLKAKETILGRPDLVERIPVKPWSNDQDSYFAGHGFATGHEGSFITFYTWGYSRHIERREDTYILTPDIYKIEFSKNKEEKITLIQSLTKGKLFWSKNKYIPVKERVYDVIFYIIGVIFYVLFGYFTYKITIIILSANSNISDILNPYITPIWKRGYYFMKCFCPFIIACVVITAVAGGGGEFCEMRGIHGCEEWSGEYRDAWSIYDQGEFFIKTIIASFVGAFLAFKVKSRPF